MKKSYYHATPFENFQSIYSKGLKKGYDGIIYLTETPEDAIKFLRIRLCQDILVIQIDLDESEVVETFDHSEAFFKCRAFGYPHDIPPESLSTGKMTRWKESRDDIR